jgi:multiple sugar transport system substrate-binding protein
MGVPLAVNPWPMHTRLDLLEQAKLEYPKTWEEFAETSKKIQSPPRLFAFGMCLGLVEDTTDNVMNLLWCYGGKMVEADNKTVVMASKENEAGVKMIEAMFKTHKIIPPGAISWDNSGNNKAYESGQVAYVLNPPSIYSSLLNNKSPFLDRTGLFPAPGGPAGRFKTGYTDYWAVFKASPYPDVARGLVRHLLEPGNYGKLIVGAGGRYLPVYPEMSKDPFWSSRPAFKGLSEIAQGAITTYWPGKVNMALAEIVNQSIVVKWLQKVLVDRMDAAEAVGKCQEEMVAIYKRYSLAA